MTVATNGDAAGDASCSSNTAAATSTPAASLDAVIKLRNWNERLKSDEGRAALSTSQVEDLSCSIDAVLEGCLQNVSKVDLLGLLQHRFIASASPSFPLPLTSVVSLPLPLPSPSSSPALPADVISLIVEEWRALFKTDPAKGLRSDVHQSWIELNKLAKVDKTWESVAGSIRRSELHLTKIDQIPIVAKHLSQSANAHLITKLYIKVADFDHFVVEESDAGFALPNLLNSLPFIRTLSITSRTNRLRRSHTFSGITGGVNLPTVIQRMKHLTRLVYGPPTYFEDMVNFFKMDLIELDVLGEVDSSIAAANFAAMFAMGGNGGINNPVGAGAAPAPFVIPPIPTFSCVKSSLRRVWTPTTTYTASQLDSLFGNSQVDQLALVVDLDEMDATEDQIAGALVDVLAAFAKIGPRLKQLALSTPRLSQSGNVSFAVGIGGGPMGAVNGGGAGGAGAANFAAAAGGGGGGANVNANGNGNGNRAAGGGGGGGGGFGGNPAAQLFFALGPGGMGGGMGGGMAGGLGGLAALFAGGAGGGMGGGGAANGQHVRHLFFDDIVQLCTSLQHLELYGRRHSHSLAVTLSSLPIRYLSLTRPRGNEGTLLLEGILALLRTPSRFKDSFEEIVFCGRNGASGGDWSASERMEMKSAVEGIGMKYSTRGD